MASLDQNEIILDTGMLYYFSKNGNKIEQPNDDENASIGTEPAGSIQVPSEWYGIAILTDCVGFGFEDAEYDIWGYVDTDSIGGAYFELYVLGDASENEFPILTMYIDEEETSWLTPIIGDEDAWIGDLYLTEDDEWELLTMYDEGALDIYYAYDDGAGASANYRFFVRECGTAWNEEIDPLPKSYAEYVVEYCSGNAADNGN